MLSKVDAVFGHFQNLNLLALLQGEPALPGNAGRLAEPANA